MKKLFIWLIIVYGLLSLGSSTYAFEIIVGSGVANDPYFQMNASNLNTMNSYILPTKNDIDPESYSTDSEWKYKITKENGSRKIIKDSSAGYKSIHIMSTYLGYVILWLLMIVVWYFGVKRKDSSFGQLLRIMFEAIWIFFEDILGVARKHWIKVYVVSLFFIILFANLFGLINDILRFIFPQYLRWVTSPTGEFESTIAFAFIAIVVTLYVQAKAVGGPHKLLHEYIPITGKGLMEGNSFFAKIGDIIISLFIGVLDIIGVFAKIISLSVRLFGNMSSGSILLNVIFIGIGMLTVNMLGFNFALFLPIIIYVQGLLGAVIQAFVFSLLVGIGIAMADD